ncbi:MAG: dolichol kinase, partial [Synechococcaceae bacterium WB9_2_170]|nr:dolichol kinase [Synechococcaceae bacterium WB9_2_170]
GLTALVAIAGIATACEQVASWGIDNFSVPILTGWLWQLWQ